MNIVASDAVITSENLGHIATGRTEIGTCRAQSVLGRGHDRRTATVEEIQMESARIENRSRIVTVVQEVIEAVTIALENQSRRRGGEIMTNDGPIQAQAGLARRDLVLVRPTSLGTTPNLRAPKNADDRLTTPESTTLDHEGHQKRIRGRGTSLMMKSGQRGWQQCKSGRRIWRRIAGRG